VTAYDLALAELRSGNQPIPVPHRKKAPIMKAWQGLILDEDTLGEHFNGVPQNIGRLNGAPSGGKVDIDLDAREAIAAAPEVLPHTPSKYGRPSAPASHWDYIADPLVPTAQFRDPVEPEDSARSMLVELRSTGSQSLRPGSTHPSGEVYEWDERGEPPRIPGPTLYQRASKLAAVTLLARRWPAVGGRHHAAVALAGGLLRGGWTAERAERLIRVVAETAGDDEVADRVKAVASTVTRLQTDQAATGFPRLAELMDPRVVTRVREWLGCRQDSLTLVPASAEMLSARTSIPMAAESIFHTAAELRDETPESLEWVVEALALAPGTLTEIDGKPKAAGKTTLILEAVRCVLNEEPFLGQPTKYTPVVYLSEQTRTSLRPALERAGLLDRDDLHILCWPDVRGRPWGEIAQLAIAKARMVGAQALVVDTLGRFAGLAGDAENSSGAALEAMGWLQAAAGQGLGVIVARHERKAGGDVGDSGRGSNQFTGDVDTVFALRRAQGEGRPTIRVLHGLSRFDQVPETLVIERTEDGYTVVGDEAAYAEQEAEAALLAVLPRTAEQAKTLDELLDATPVKRTIAQKVLKGLRTSERVQREGKGKKGDPYRFWRAGQPLTLVAPIDSAATPAIVAESKSAPEPPPDDYYLRLAEAYEADEADDEPAPVPNPSGLLKPCPMCSKEIPTRWLACTEHEPDWRDRLAAQETAS
jgi:hypothetical protein